MRRLGLLVTSLLLTAPGWGGGVDDAPGGSQDAWLRYRGPVLKEPSLLRFYSFDEMRDASSQAPDLAGKGGAMAFDVAQKQGAPQGQFLRVAGRWPGRQAVRLDQGYLFADDFAPVNKAFTVEAWLRVLGPGTHRGNGEATNGTLLSVGGGYWDGWRVTMSYPSRILGFEIGRPQPSHSVGMQTTPVADGVWHHLAASWDGQTMRVYVDGLLAGSGACSGAYTPPGDKHFRVGFADAGLGSVVMDADEVVVFGRAKSAVEILADAHFYAPLAEADAERFRAAERLFESKDYPAASAGFAALAGAKGLDEGYRAVARLRLAQSLRAERKSHEAAIQLAAVLDTPALPTRHTKAALDALLQLFRLGAVGDLSRSVYERILAMDGVTAKEKLNTRILLAQSLREQRDFAAACEQYRHILAIPELTQRERLDVQCELGHTRWESGDTAGARAEYRAVLAAADAPAPYRSAARLRIAAAFARERNYPETKAEYARILAMTDAPEHHRWEAGERLRELVRVEAGLPPRDPAWSRVQLPAPPEPAVTLYVEPDGSDENPGTRRKPFATIQRARDEIRALKKKGELPAGGVAVLIGGGEYRLTAGLQFGVEDSGTDAAPIVYRAAGRTAPRFTGGIPIPHFEPVKDAAILERLDEAVRDKVVQADLRALGVKDLGEAFTAGKRLELFFDGEPMPLARWPNEGYLRVGELRGEKTFNVWGSIKGNHDGKFTYDGDRPNRWKDEKDAWLYGFWFWDWADGYQKVASIDAEQRVITTAPPHHGYGFRSGQRYFALNLLAELDAPGEWYLDRSTGVLYFYPPSRVSRATVEISLLSDPMVTMDGVSHVTLRGLTFETSRNHGAVIRGGERCLLAGCTFRRLGESGVIIEGGAGHGILGCDIYSVGRNGTWVKGGDRKTLTPGGHFVENCHIHDFSRVYRTYTPAVLLEGAGNRVAHNLFHHAPHSAMRVEGNDHVVEFNEVHSVVYDADDQGAVDMWFNPAYRGNVFRFNYWHHVGSGLGHGNAGIRLDDAICGVLIYGNVFYRSSDASFGGVQIHGGKENILDGNLFLDCKAAVSCSAWGDKRWRESITSPDALKRILEDVNINQPPYSTRYPDLARLAEGHDANSLWRNFVGACGAFVIRDPGVLDYADNYVTSRDPGLVDPVTGELRLRRLREIAEGLGPLPVGMPLEEIGLYKDDYRASWPVRHKVIESYKPPSF